jgi:hypothetical protein
MDLKIEKINQTYFAHDKNKTSTKIAKRKHIILDHKVRPIVRKESTFVLVT